MRERKAIKENSAYTPSKKNNSECSSSPSEASSNGALNNFYITFPNYFLFWVKNYSKKDERYTQLLEFMTVHELRLNRDALAREGSGDIRRFFWIEIGKIMAFAMMCDEYASQKLSYVAFLESSSYLDLEDPPEQPASIMRPVIRAYAEYVSLISSGWVLHIWADPPTENEDFLFRKVPRKLLTNSAATLKLKYSGLLNDSGFLVGNYQWHPTLPPLPDFGKKAESNIQEQFENMKKEIEEKIRLFNSQFGHTLVAKLELDSDVNAPTFNRMAKVCENMIDEAYFNSNKGLDFSTKKSAQRSTLVLKGMLYKLGKSDGIFYYYSNIENVTYLENHYARYVNLFPYEQ